MKPPVESVKRALEPARPRWIVLPKYEAGRAALLEPLSKARTFMHLAENAFNYDLHGQNGFDFLAQTVDNCDGFQFAYGRLDDACAVFDEVSSRP